MIDFDEVSELRSQVRYTQRHQRMLFASPDCNDPDHPGCPCCDDDEGDDE